MIQTFQIYYFNVTGNQCQISSSENLAITIYHFLLLLIFILKNNTDYQNIIFSTYMNNKILLIKKCNIIHFWLVFMIIFQSLMNSFYCVDIISMWYLLKKFLILQKKWTIKNVNFNTHSIGLKIFDKVKFLEAKTIK